MSMSKQELAELVQVLVEIEAVALAERYDGIYDNDVVDASEYPMRLSRKDEERRKARFAELEMMYIISKAQQSSNVAAQRKMLCEAVYADALALAKAFIRPLSKRVDNTTRSELRKIVAAHKSSDDSMVFAYLTMMSIIGWEREQDEVVREQDVEYDGLPEQMGALVREIQMPTEREVSLARRRAYAA
jgi:hypothetical protein